jgi:3-deoxy-D-manno-octulosonate 8-phosphate phosphatase (KDO 8-P phosphatase)
VRQGAEDKVAALEQLCAKLKIEPSACACIGDDVPDVPVMRKVALAFAVADAHPEARHAAHLITKLPGGHGAVREVCDYLMAHGSPGPAHGSARRPHKARSK